MIRYLNESKNDLARKQLENMRMNVYMIQENINTKHLAFCVLVKSINGEMCNDISDEGLKRTLERFKDIKVTEIMTSLEEVKKK